MLFYRTPNKEFKLQNIIQKWKQMQYLCTTVTPYKNGQECLVQASTCEGMVFVSWRLQDMTAFWKCSIPGATLPWKWSPGTAIPHCALFQPSRTRCDKRSVFCTFSTLAFSPWYFPNKTTNQSGRVTSLQTQMPFSSPGTLAWPFPCREAEPMWVGPVLLIFFQWFIPHFIWWKLMVTCNNETF